MNSDLPRGVASVSECHVSCSKVVELSQSTQAAVNGMTSLHTHQRGNTIGVQRRRDVTGAGSKEKSLWIFLHHHFDDVNLINECPGSIEALSVAAHVGRPELEDCACTVNCVYIDNVCMVASISNGGTVA